MSKRTYKKYLKKQNETIPDSNSHDLAQPAPIPAPVPAEAPCGQTDFFIQYQNQEYLERDVIAKIKEKCKADGTEISETDKLSVYLKPEDGKAYYTFADVSGSVEL